MKRRRMLAAVGLTGLIAVSTACGAAPEVAMGGASTVVVGSARTGSPLPGWNDQLEQRFRADVARGGSWTFVSVDGRPSVVDTLDLRVAGDNDLIVAGATESLRAEAERRLGLVRADDPEVDVLGALVLAARVLADQPDPRTILLQDSLLQTAGVLRFQDHGGALLGADPVAVADQLAAAGELPSLAGIEVVLIGAGDAVAPQDALSPPLRTSLLALWTAVLERSGGRVRVLDAPVAGDAVGGLPPVSPVPVAPPRPVDGPVAVPDSAIGFVADQAVLRDPAQAAAAVEPFARRLLAGGVRTVLTGTTSSAGTPEGRLALSRDRAAVVAGLLQAAGVPAALIQSRGVGADFPDFIPDRDGAGGLDPVRAAANRKVIIELIPVD